MRDLRVVAALLVLGVVVLALGGCPPKETEQAAAPGGPTGPAGPAPTPESSDEPVGDTGAGTADTGALTKEAVTGVLQSMEDDAVTEKLEGIGKDLGLEDAESAESLKAIMDKAAESDEVAAAVKPYGFDSAAAWVDALTRVLPGLMRANAKALGLEDAGDMSVDDEFAVFVEAYGEPSEEDIDVIAEVIEEQLEADHPATPE